MGNTAVGAQEDAVAGVVDAGYEGSLYSGVRSSAAVGQDGTAARTM